MKPFDPTKPVQTRDGRKARIVCTDAKSEYPIVALVLENGVEEHSRHTICGHWWSSKMDCNNDLVNIPIKHKRTIFLNVYKDYIVTHESEYKAKASISPGIIASIKFEIEFEEGEGLSQL